MASVGAVLFSGKAVIIKYAYRYDVSPEALLALRMLLALPMFWCVYWFFSRNNKKSPLSKTDYLKLIGLGFIGYFFSSYLDFLGLQYISVGLERILLYLTPTIVILISYFFMQKRITRLQWYAMVIGYLGVMLVFLQDVGTKGDSAWLGALLVFGSTCMYAAYLISAGEMVNRIGSMRLVTYATSAWCLIYATAPSVLVELSECQYLHSHSDVFNYACHSTGWLFSNCTSGYFGAPSNSLYGLVFSG